jgi:hypothetical protein
MNEELRSLGVPDAAIDGYYRGPDELFEEGVLSEAVRVWLEWLARGDEELERSRGLAREITDQGLFTLRAVGNDRPEWDVFVAARPNEDSPLFSAAVAAEVDAWSRWAEAPEERPRPDSPEAHDEYAGRAINALAPGEVSKDVALDIRRPAWAPYPIAPLGRVGSSIDWPPVLLNEGPDRYQRTANQRTIDAFRYEDSSGNERLGLVAAMADEEIELTDGATRGLREMERIANARYELLQLGAPELRCDVRHPDEWYVRPPLRWLAHDPVADAWVSLEELSDMQARWAEFAIASAADELARRATREAPSVLLDLPGELLGVSEPFPAIGIVDEPERGAHPLAVTYLREGLGRFSALVRSPVVVATHAPDFLGDPGIALVHVRRNGATGTESVEMPALLRQDLDRVALGLRAADILQLCRAFLAVEGEHDIAVISTLIGEDLDRARVRVVAMRGAHNAPALADAQLIFDFTDTNLVVVLDHVSAQRAHVAWAAAKSAMSQPAKNRRRVRGEAFKALEPLTKSRNPEERYLGELCNRAIDTGRADRIQIFGLHARDILRYLDVESFVPGAPSWEALEAEWNHVDDFKQWLRRRYHARITVRTIRRAAESLDTIPDELRTLADVCCAAATRYDPAPGAAPAHC